MQKPILTAPRLARGIYTAAALSLTNLTPLDVLCPVMGPGETGEKLESDQSSILL